jgi:hypothetical protein
MSIASVEGAALRPLVKRVQGPRVDASLSLVDIFLDLTPLEEIFGLARSTLRYQPKVRDDSAIII